MRSDGAINLSQIKYVGQSWQEIKQDPAEEKILPRTSNLNNLDETSCQ